MDTNGFSDKNRELWEKIKVAKEQELKERTPESKIGKMIEFLKQLDEDECIFCEGDSPGSLVGSTLVSVTRDGVHQHGNLDDAYVGSCGPFTDEEIEVIQERMDSSDTDNDDIEVIALRKGHDLKKKIYYAYMSWYRVMDLEDIEDEIEFCETYETAFQFLGMDAEYFDNLNTWDALSSSDIEKYYAAVFKYKTGEPCEQEVIDAEKFELRQRAIASENRKKHNALQLRVLEVIYSPNGKQIASKVMLNGAVLTWDIKLGKLLWIKEMKNREVCILFLFPHLSHILRKYSFLNKLTK